MHALCHIMHHLFTMRKLCTIMRVYALLCPVHNAQVYGGEPLRAREWRRLRTTGNDRQLKVHTDNIEEREGRGKWASSGIVLWC